MPLILGGSLLGIGAIALVVVLIVTSGPSEQERYDSYAAGYIAAVEARTSQVFGSSAPREEDQFEKFKGSYKGGQPQRREFIQGFSDGQSLQTPEFGGDEIKVRAYSAKDAISALDKALERSPDHAPHVWNLIQKVEALSDSWKRQDVRPAEIAQLDSSRKDLLKRLVALDPNHADARKALGQVKYENTLEPFITASDYLNEAERAKARKEHERLMKSAEAQAGWFSPKELDQAKKMLLEFEVKRETHLNEVASTPFFQAAKEIEAETAKELIELLGKAKENFDKMTEKDDEDAEKRGFDRKELEATMLKGVADRKFTAILREPYVVFVEENTAWTPSHVAEQEVFNRLIPLNKTFLSMYQERFNLPPLDKPIPVVLLRGKLSYLQYNLGKNGAWPTQVAAHFEPDNGRLVVPADTDWTTTLHEGTHQLFHFYRKNRPEFLAQSFWFEEGVAEWFSGATRKPDASGNWIYETGLLQERRFNGVRQMFALKQHLPLRELLGATYASRNAWMQTAPHKIHLTYAQGWMLIYFMNYFDLDEDGYVKIDTLENPVVGKYREGWDRYLAFELLGKDDAPYTGKDAFMEAMQVDEDGLKKISDEFEAYQRFILRKMNIGQTKDKRLVPWDQAKDSEGQVIGDREDDLLIPPTEDSK